MLALLTFGPACNTDPGKSVAMQDTLDLTLFGPVHDDMHTPYVQGSKFTVNIASTDYSPSESATWTLRSSDPSIIQIGAPSDGGSGFQVFALGAGHTVLTVLDAGGSVLDSHAVDVAQPDHVELCSRGLLLAGYSDAQAQITQASLVEQGTATFLVRYYLGGQEIWGNNAVTATGSGAVTAMTTTSTLGDERDWIRVDASQAGSGQVSLVIGNAPATVIPTTVVASTSIQSVGALMQSDSGASDGNLLYVFARAFDARGGDIYGGSFSWMAGGSPVASTTPASDNQPTDALAYTYKGSASETVSVALDGYTSSPVTIHGTGATVTSTAATNCSVGRAPGRSAGAGSALMLGWVAAGAFAARSRRRGAGDPAGATREAVSRVGGGTRWRQDVAALVGPVDPRPRSTSSASSCSADRRT
jgi:hypothetical protein